MVNIIKYSLAVLRGEKFFCSYFLANKITSWLEPSFNDKRICLAGWYFQWSYQMYKLYQKSQLNHDLRRLRRVSTAKFLDATFPRFRRGSKKCSKINLIALSKEIMVFIWAESESKPFRLRRWSCGFCGFQIEIQLESGLWNHGQLIRFAISLKPFICSLFHRNLLMAFCSRFHG